MVQELPHPHTSARPAARPPTRWLRAARVGWAAVAISAATLTLMGIPAQYEALGRLCHDRADLLPYTFCVNYHFAWEIVLALIFFGSGALVFRAQPSGAMPLFLGLLLIIGGATEPSMTDALVFGGTASSVPWLRWPVLALRAGGVAGMIIFFYVFPDGRFVPRVTRWLALGWLALSVAWLLNPMLPGNAIYGPGWRASLTFSLAHFALWLATGVMALIYRFWRTADAIQRQQVKWGGFGLTLAVVGQLYYYAHDLSLFGFPNRLNAYDALATPALRTLLSACGPVCLGIAVARHRLWDIDRLISRTLLYALLTAAVIALYSALVTAMSVLLRSSAPVSAMIASALVAALLQPLHRWLQQTLNRVMYGHRDDPQAAMQQLAIRLESTLHADAILPAIAETISRGFRIPSVWVEIHAVGGDPIASAAHGPPGIPALTLPLLYQRETIGMIGVGERAPGEVFSAADRRALADIAAQASVAASALRLNLELAQSRERLRSALEEGRRRMRQNLHDGLGPALASQQYTLAAIERLIPRDPDGAAALLRELRAQSRAMVDDVRRLVEDLRPPTLDDLGLVQALRERVAAYGHAPLAITIEAPEPLPALPAAVEVAAYYLVMEGVTNVVRHAGASACRVTLRLGRALEIMVVDDGRGLPHAYRAGTGIRSMRERALELGGTWRIAALPRGGTEVYATLPVAQEEE